MDERVKFNYYAVLGGNEPGIFSTWNECEEAKKNYPDCKFKGFFTKKAAEKWIETQGKTVIFDDEDTLPWMWKDNNKIINPNVISSQEPELKKSFANIYIATTALTKEETKPGAYAVKIRFLNGKDDDIVCKNGDIIFSRRIDHQASDSRLRALAVIDALARIKDKNKQEPVSIYVPDSGLICNYLPDEITKFEEKYKTIENKYEYQIIQHKLICLLRDRPVRYCWKKHYTYTDIFKILKERAKREAYGLLKPNNLNENALVEEENVGKLSECAREDDSKPTDRTLGVVACITHNGTALIEDDKNIKYWTNRKNAEGLTVNMDVSFLIREKDGVLYANDVKPVH